MRQEHLWADMITKFPKRGLNPMPKVSSIQVQVMENKAINQNVLLLPLYQEFKMSVGQTPELRYARKSMASFKLRQGAEIGLNVTVSKRDRANYLTYLMTMVLPWSRSIPEFNLSGAGDLHFGLGPYKYETHPNGNILIRIGKEMSPKEKKFIFSYMLFPIK